MMFRQRSDNHDEEWKGHFRRASWKGNWGLGDRKGGWLARSSRRFVQCLRQRFRHAKLRTDARVLPRYVCFSHHQMSLTSNLHQFLKIEPCRCLISLWLRALVWWLIFQLENREFFKFVNERFKITCVWVSTGFDSDARHLLFCCVCYLRSDWTVPTLACGDVFSALVHSIRAYPRFDVSNFYHSSGRSNLAAYWQTKVATCPSKATRENVGAQRTKA